MKKPSPSSFAGRLRKWRGARLQKEVAVILDVEKRTYQGWEGGYHEPTGLTKKIVEKMISK